MTYYSDLGKALQALDQDRPVMNISRRGPHAAHFTETFEQDGDTTYVDANAKYLADETSYAKCEATVPQMDAHFQAQAINLTQAEVGQQKVVPDQSNDPEYFENTPDAASTKDETNDGANMVVTDFRANVPTGMGNGTDLLVQTVNQAIAAVPQAATDAQALMTQTQAQLTPILASAQAQAPGIMATIQSKPLSTALMFSGLSWLVTPKFIPGAKLLPFAIMAVWAIGQNKPKV